MQDFLFSDCFLSMTCLITLQKGTKYLMRQPWGYWKPKVEHVHVP